ncbi:MAG: interleukin-like EMT inducer domain-containing protein [Methanothrix sp.]|jgi:hypothetical protein|nr:interleukin-like EMT inducer domain-containing protein [Methanothrix sp.]
MTSELWGYWSENTVRMVGDYRSQYWPGLIVRLVQGGAEKFFRITDVSYDGQYTYLTLHGGGLYTLGTEPITEHQHSPYLAPRGFPIGFDLLPQYLADRDHASTSLHTPGTVVPVVTSVGNPGSDSNIPSEKAVRSAVNEKLSVIMTIEVRSVGLSSQVNEFGRGIWVNGTRVLEQGRSYGLVVIDRNTLQVVFTGTYDVFGSSSNAEALANKLASYDQNYIVAIGTYDEPRENRTTSPLPYQIARCGGTRSLFLSSGFKYRSAYALIGVPGFWEGAGFEAYSGNTDDDTLAYCYLAVYVLSNGSLVKAGPMR